MRGDYTRISESMCANSGTGSRFSHAILCLVCVVAVLALFSYLNILQPICSDDFCYSFVFGEEKRVASFADVIRSQTLHWQRVNGRFWSHCVVQFWLMFDKSAFNIANVICYAASCFLLSRLLFQKRRRLLIGAVVVFSTFWIMMPHPGSSLVWLTGSVNYLWSTCLVLLYLNLLLSLRKGCVLSSLLLSVPAGNSHEGISVGVLCFLLLSLCFIRKKHTFGFYLSIVLFAVGVLANVLAPGTSNRAGVAELHVGGELMLRYYQSLRWFIGEDVIRGRDIGVQLGFILSLALASVHVVRGVLRLRIDWVSVLLLLGAYVNMLLCFLAFAMYPRALFGFCLMTYASLLRFSQAVNWGRLKEPCCIGLIGAVSILNLLEYPKAVAAISALRGMMEHVRAELNTGRCLVRETPEWEQLKHSRYVERIGLSASALDNTFLCRLWGASELCVLSSAHYENLKANEQKIRSLAVHKHARLDGRNAHIMRLLERPEMVKVISKVVHADRGDIRTRVHFQLLPYKKFYFVCWADQFTNVEVEVMYSGKNMQRIIVNGITHE